MNRLFPILLLVLFTALTIGGFADDAQPSLRKKAAAMKEKEKKEAAKEIIIDVRNENEFADGHLDKALNIPVQVIAEKIAAAVPDKKAKIMVYCRSGNRSGKAKTILTELGYTDVTNGGAFDELRKKRPVAKK